MTIQSITPRRVLAAITTILGTSIIFLGILWIVQGLGIVQIEPILCVSNCEPITERSMTWTVVGLVTTAVGTTLALFGFRHSRR
ncbi:hypothetical protein [Halocatena halophila]|uniref:hypothetical protein n=1 Tax=Halocatena halophila TaxID=2814576 RepID=UPI002ED15FEC